MAHATGAGQGARAFGDLSGHRGSDGGAMGLKVIPLPERDPDHGKGEDEPCDGETE